MAKGYTKIENDLFEFLYSCKLKASELKVLLFLIRFTKGFNRDTARAGYSYISSGTGLSMSATKRAVKNLIEKGYVSIAFEHKGSAAQVVKLEYSQMTTSYGHVRPHHMVNSDPTNVVSSEPQDITEYITDITLKNIKASPSFSDQKLSLEELARLSQEDEDGDL